MALRQAFNAITRMHSRAATLKRANTTVDIYSPIRITPSNYFRFLEGPSSTVVRGREFIIPTDTMKGQSTQLITFDVVPTEGGFILTYNSVDTAVILFDATASDVEDALQDIPALAGVTVTGDFTAGFLVTFSGVITPLLLSSSLDATPLDAEITIAVSDSIPWSPVIKRGDKIFDSIFGHMAIDEIIEVVDIGGIVMGFRVRCE